MKRINLFVVLIVIILIQLTGCSKCLLCTTPNAIITGVGMKGTIINAKVSAFTIENGAVSTTPLATTLSDENGNFGLMVEEYSGPVLLVIEPQKNSKTTCDARPKCGEIEFGQSMNLNFKLETVVYLNGEPELTANITPMTSMAAAYAKKNGVSAQLVTESNRRVAQLFQLSDVIKLRPVNITDARDLDDNDRPLDAYKYGYYSAAIEKIAYDRYNGDIQKTLDVLISNYIENNGELRKSNSGATTDTISLADIATAARDIAEKESRVSNETFKKAKRDILTLLTSTGANETENETTTSIEPGPLTADEIETAKKTVQELRTWTYQLQTNLRDSTQRFATKLKNGLEHGSDAYLAVAQTSIIATFVMFDCYVKHDAGMTSGTVFNLRDYAYPFTPDVSGTIHIDGNTVWLANATINGASVIEKLEMSASTTGTSFTFKLIELSIDTTGASLISNDTSQSNNSITITYEQPINDLFSGDIAIWPKQIDFQYDGELKQKHTTTNTDPISFGGFVNGTVVFVKNTNQLTTKAPVVNAKSIEYRGDFSTESGDSLSASITYDMKNAETFISPGALFIPSNSPQHIGNYWFSDNRNSLTLSTPNYTVTYSYDAATKSIYTVETISQVYVYVSHSTKRDYSSLQDFINTNVALSGNCNGCMQVWLDHQGMYRLDMPDWQNDAGKLYGRLDVPGYDDENTGNWRDIDVHFSTTLDLNDMPPATINIDFYRTGYRSFRGSVSANYASVQILAELSNSSAQDWFENHRYHLFIETSAGGRLEIYRDRTTTKMEGAIKVNGKRAGIFSTDPVIKQLRIDYADGQFESVLF